MVVDSTTVAYGSEAVDALRTLVTRTKRDDPMAPVTVLVPNNIAGIVARRQLARRLPGDGAGIAGIWFSTLPRLAEQLAAATLTGQGRRPATRPVTTAAIRAGLSADPGGFGRVAEHPSTARAIARAHRALRDVDDDALARLAETTALAGDLVRVHRDTAARLREHWYDTTDLLATATDLLLAGAVDTERFGAVVLYLPQELTRAEMGLIRALAARTEMQVIAALTGRRPADQPVLDVLAALRIEPRPRAAAQPDDRADLPRDHAPRPPGATEPLAHRVRTASDSDDEVRVVVREVVETLRRTPAHRVAVLYAAQSPYARLLHEHLAAAEISVNGPGVRPVEERGVARLVLGLLTAARTGFRRNDVMRAVGEVSTMTFTGDRVSVARWERVSREAGVVGGADWALRLGIHAQRQGHLVDAAEYDSQRQRATRAGEAAIELRDFMIELQRRFAEGAASPSWAALGEWALELTRVLLPPERHTRLPLEEQYAVGVVERTLAGLAALDGQGLPATLRGLEEILGVELEAALPRVGRFGEGVLVAPITHAVGLDLDAVFVVGLAEDLFPGRLQEDSLLPDRVRAASHGQLPPTRAVLDRQHRCLLAAFSCATQVTATFPRGDLRRHTNRLPSRWLLPTLRHLTGNQDLVATEWEHATQHSGDWLAGSPSYAGSLLTTRLPSSGQEWRIRAAMAGQHLDDPAITAARRLRAARESTDFTRFDGNLAGQDGLPQVASGDRLISPTALEHYAVCPHTYFVQRLLGVEPVEAPEEAVEISPLDVGNLIHESFDALITEAGQRDELPGYGEPWTDAQRKRLQELAGEKADRYEAEGRTGHPRLWPRMRAELLEILDWMIHEDNRWRAEQDARVVASELPFGLHGAEPVTLVLAGGTGHAVRFRGSADKVDQTRDGTLLVTDIKSGSRRTFTALESDPVAHGEKLQLPVYALAARAAHGAADTPVRAMYWFVRRDRGRIEIALTDEVRQRYAATVGRLVSSLTSGAFPQRAPGQADFRWVQCPYCNPDGLGHGAVRERWERKRLAPELADYTALVEPDALQAADAAQEHQRAKEING